jgi:CRP/FNR family transcriptional regulator, cyclic AMP receptor protein
MAADPAIVDALGKTDLFGSLSPRALRKVAATAREISHPDGKEITEEGGSGVGFHLIRAGKATVSVGGAARPDLGPGDYFGEISLIDGRPRSATVTAHDNLRTISLVQWDFLPILDSEPEVSKGLLKHLCERLRAAEEH